MSLTRYIVFGYYTEDPQVVLDIVDAENDEAAEERIKWARNASSTGYVADGAETLDDYVERYKDLQQRSAEDTEAAINELAQNYRDDVEDNSPTGWEEC
jgi:hypothetical protein